MNRTLYAHAARNFASSDYNLILCLIWILQRNFELKLDAIMSVAQYTTTSHGLQQQNMLLDGLFNELQQRPVMTVSISRSIYRHQLWSVNWKMGKADASGAATLTHLKNSNCGLLFLDSMQAFHHFVANIAHSNVLHGLERQGHYVVVYTGNDLNSLAVFKHIFDKLFQHYFLNVNILALHGEAAAIYTFYPFTPIACASTEPQLLWLYNSSTLEAEIFPNKLRNFYGCPLTVWTHHELPMMMLTRNSSTGAVESMRGIEGDLLRLLASQLNFSMQVTLKQFTITSGIADLKTAPPNITIGGFWYSFGLLPYLQTSIFYRKFYMVFAIVKTPTQLINYNMWNILSAPLHILDFSILLGAILVICIIRRLKRPTCSSFVFGYGNRWPITNLLSVYLYGPTSTRLPTRNFARFLLLLWLLYSFIMRAVISGGMYRALNSLSARELPQLEPASYAYEKIYAPPILASNAFIRKARLYLCSYDYANHSLEALMARDLPNNIAYIMSDAVLKYSHAPSSEWHKKLTILPAKVATLNSVLYMRKGSYLKKPIDAVLKHALDVGIFNRYERFYLQLEVPKLEDQRKPLSLQALSMIFLAHCLYSSVSILVFALELVAHRWPKLARLIATLNC